MSKITLKEFNEKFERRSLPFSQITPPDLLSLYVRQEVDKNHVDKLYGEAIRFMDRPDFTKEMLWSDFGPLYIGMLNGQYVILDGVHRYTVYAKLIKEYPNIFSEDDEIPVFVRNYGTDEAEFIRDSVYLNNRHGQQMSDTDKRKALRLFFINYRKKHNITDYYEAVSVIEEYAKDFGFPHLTWALKAIDNILPQLWQKEVDEYIKPKLSEIAADYKAGKIGLEELKNRIEKFVVEYLEVRGKYVSRDMLEKEIDRFLTENEIGFSALGEEDDFEITEDLDSIDEEEETIEEQVTQEEVKKAVESVTKKTGKTLYEQLSVIEKTMSSILTDLKTGIYDEESIAEFHEFIHGILDVIEDQIGDIRSKIDEIAGVESEEEEEENE